MAAADGGSGRSLGRGLTRMRGEDVVRLPPARFVPIGLRRRFCTI
ncbi:MAG TPA: hypothetical protein VNO26_07590 [Candidatus Limnocylindria bacterium]|nr:hypothetical protein [Candidatus Limnocylindria bacterium]